MSTTLVRNERDAWIRENRHRINKASLGTIASEMRKLGFYSRKTSILHAAQALLLACRRLEIEL